MPVNRQRQQPDVTPGCHRYRTLSRHLPPTTALYPAQPAHALTGKYTIYLDSTRNLLFAPVEIESEERWNAVASTEVYQRWWKHMKDVMPANSDNSPVSSELQEVFYLA
ncbi:L-rhamnose mutarotase [Escherichia sp. E1V33]|nr:L-rhamnose mutarotase [Escherichia sp. E1V33]TBR64400.1 L-rhamnose mutarotase [Escherichia sp. E1S7]